MPDDEDDAGAVPKSVVIDPRFDWEGDRRPDTPLHETVIYETHVRGFTRLHPEVREDLRGTYAGLASEPAIAYLRSLGVTAVELLPVHHIVDESFLFEQRPLTTTGATRRSATSPRTPATPRPASAARRCASSRAWSRRCTAPASR